MADILYTYKNQVYLNITNKCDCSCTFCIRTTKDTVGDATDMWFSVDPTIDEIKAAIDSFDFLNYDEAVFCGYGEPTCALENMIQAAAYIKEKHGLKIRLNTNGLANLYYGRDIIPEIKEVVDRVSISLNAPDAEKYQAVTRPHMDNAFPAMLAFAKEAGTVFEHVQFSVVDVLTKEEIEQCQRIANEQGVFLKVRKKA